MHKSKGKKATTLPFYKYFIKRFGYKLAFNRAIRKSKKIIVPSKYVKEQLINYYKVKKDKIKVCYEGMSAFNQLSKFTFSSREVLKKYKLEKPYFIYVGNAYPHKNLGRAIEAIRVVNEMSSTKIGLAIVSSRDIFTKRLKKQIKNHNANKYVVLTGFVPDEQLDVLLKNSAGFVYPSFSEGFGLQGLESMASGTLVLASEIPAFKEIYKDNVIYFNPYDFSSIVKALQSVLSMKEKEREKIITKNKQYIKRYSWKNMAEETQNMYKSALKGEVV
jgi:glycosyltransferase involved in cell wall biosynthesis